MVIEMFEEKPKKGLDFLEVTEITDLHISENGIFPHNEVGYVAGICRNREPKSKGDSGNDVYNLIYFKNMVKRKVLWERATFKQSSKDNRLYPIESSETRPILIKISMKKK